MKNKIEVCLSPNLYSLFEPEGKAIVVVDVFRATSAICTAFEYGVSAIIPVAEVEEALQYKEKGYIAAAERGGEVVEGFDFGNSPYSYMDDKVKGKEVVLTTTNGTRALDAARSGEKVIVGSFLNLGAVAGYLEELGLDVIVFCAGWRGRVCIEDAAFAGALVELMLAKGFETACDSARIMQSEWEQAKKDLPNYMNKASHRARLSGRGLDKDIAFCLQLDITRKVPVLNGDKLQAD